MRLWLKFTLCRCFQKPQSFLAQNKLTVWILELAQNKIVEFSLFTRRKLIMWCCVIDVVWHVFWFLLVTCVVADGWKLLTTGVSATQNKFRSQAYCQTTELQHSIFLVSWRDYFCKDFRETNSEYALKVKIIVFWKSNQVKKMKSLCNLSWKRRKFIFILLSENCYCNLI